MKTEFKPALLHLKLTFCYILPVAEGLGKYNLYLGFISLQKHENVLI